MNCNIYYIYILYFRSCILACKAYVSLGLGDPIVALSAASQLLHMKNLPGGLKSVVIIILTKFTVIFRYAAKVYLAESYAQLGRYQECLPHLTTEFVTDLEVSREPLGMHNFPKYIILNFWKLSKQWHRESWSPYSTSNMWANLVINNMNT